MVSPARNASLPETDSSFHIAVEAGKVIKRCMVHAPTTAFFWGASVQVPDRFTNETLSYKAIPGFPALDNGGGDSNSISSVMLNGRSYYSLCSIDSSVTGEELQVGALPVRVMREIGVQTVVFINTCSPLHAAYKQGDLCLLKDHINFLGSSPLIGTNIDQWGPRFPDMTEPYNPGLRASVIERAGILGVHIRESVFAALRSFPLDKEEAHFLHKIGADISGRGFVNEVLVARHMGLRVLALSFVVNNLDESVVVPEDLSALIDSITPEL